MVPNIACLCPTAWRPECLANAIACFQAQDYPIEHRTLYILDDTATLSAQSGPGWNLYTVPHADCPTLPTKFNRLLQLSQHADIIVVWEDDDIYLPWHLSTIAKALTLEVQHHEYSPVTNQYMDWLARAEWAKPSTVWSLYTGKLQLEPAAGRFHASLAMWRQQFVHKLGGWFDTARADFDQQLIASLYDTMGQPADPCELAEPSYVFRWASTEAYHGQGYMREASDTGWYERAYQAGRKAFYAKRLGSVEPVLERIALDGETAAVYSLFRKTNGTWNRVESDPQ